MQQIVLRPRKGSVLLHSTPDGRSLMLADNGSDCHIGRFQACWNGLIAQSPRFVGQEVKAEQPTLE